MTLTVIPRAGWGAQPPRLAPTKLTSFDSGWFIHWLGVAAANGLNDGQVLRNTQRFHMDDRGWNDIAYSFAVGRSRPDTVYELRGWGVSGAHTEGHNRRSMAIVFLLGQGEVPTPTMLATCKQFLAEAPARYQTRQVRPHGAVSSTACPGPTLTDWTNAGLPTPPNGDTMPTTPTEWSLLNLDQVVRAVGELYGCYRDTPLTPLAELDAWGRDLAAKLAKGEDPIPTLRYIQHALAKEPRNG